MGEWKKYIAFKAVVLVTLQLGYLLIGIFLYKQNIGGYVELMQSEVNEWAQGPITDIMPVSANQSAMAVCPSGYATLLGNFYGTKDVCVLSDSAYYVEDCWVRSKGYTQPGVQGAPLLNFNNNIICYKRNQSLSYHQLISTFRSNVTCQASQQCGSQQWLDKQFCMNGCLATAVNISGATNSSGSKQFGLNWTINYSFNNVSNNPISALSFMLSRPCAITSQPYIQRTNPIQKFYSADECQYNENGDEEHYMYQTAGFDAIEFDVYIQNSLLDLLKLNVVNYTDSELKQNTYKIFYKPYALWTITCQQQYSSQYVVSQSLLIGTSVDYYSLIFRVTVPLFSFMVGCIIIHLIFSSQSDAINFTLLTIGYLCELALNAANLAVQTPPYSPQFRYVRQTINIQIYRPL